VVEITPDMLRVHHVVGPAVCLPGDHGDLRDGRLAEGVEELCTMPDDSPPLLIGSGEEAGDVLEDDKWDVEAVAEPHESRPLYRCVDVENAGKACRLICDDADG